MTTGIPAPARDSNFSSASCPGRPAPTIANPGTQRTKSGVDLNGQRVVFYIEYQPPPHSADPKTNENVMSVCGATMYAMDNRHTPKSHRISPRLLAPRSSLLKSTGKDATSMVNRIRHHETPEPRGCRWCGRIPRSHGLFYTRSVGNHYYVEPTARQRLARIRSRAVN